MKFTTQMMKKVIMNKRVWLYVLMFSLFIALNTGASQEKKINWIRYDKTIEVSEFREKPGLLFFSVSSQMYDRSSMIETREDLRAIVNLPTSPKISEDFITQSRKFSCFYINIDYRPQLAVKYGVMASPTVIFTDPWGNEMSRYTGFVSVDALVPVMEAFPADFSQMVEWRAVLDKDSNNYEALNGMASFYLNLKAWELSNQYYNKALKTENVQEEQELKEGIMLVIGLNELRMKDYKKAQKAFESCIEGIEQGKESDKAMLGMIIAQLGQGKISNAKRTLAGLKSQFPDSPAILQAERYIQSVIKKK